MRFLHTADWHLGRLFHGLHLTDDQADLLLGEFTHVIREARLDAVLIAGDVYDRSQPPPEAIALLDELLSRLILDLEVPVVMIAGNHDSPQRLQFGARLLAARGLHIRGTLAEAWTPLAFSDAAGTVEVCVLPYAEPAVVREGLGEPSIQDHCDAMRAAVRRFGQAGGARRILLAHAFVTGGASSESERPLSVGGTGEVDAGCFEGFQYVALGHLHAPQSVNPRIRYSGSLMKYSFSEASQRKAVSIVEMSGDGGCRIEEVSLSPRRDVRRIEGRLQELLGTPPASGREDYLEVTLLDEGAVFDAMGRLRTVYPNVLHVQRKEALLADDRERSSGGDRRRMTHLQLFRDFHRHVTGEEMSAEQEKTFASVVETVEREAREAGE
jgi:exonuclease SbcD